MQGAIGLLLLLLLLAALLLLHALALLVLVDLPTHRRALHALLHVMHRAALAILTLRIRCGLLLLHRRRLLLLRSSDAEQCQERHAGGEAGGRFHCCGGSSSVSSDGRVTRGRLYIRCCCIDIIYVAVLVARPRIWFFRRCASRWRDVGLEALPTKQASDMVPQRHMRT